MAMYTILYDIQTPDAVRCLTVRRKTMSPFDPNRLLSFNFVFVVDM